ncbi:MAG: AraC family transcriptional regulator [Clostridia bacterium]|nr:AraC family transcriptional regulator [Clostridia bacterium]
MASSAVTSIARKTTPYREGIHFHSGYELIFVEAGEISVSVGKKTFVASANTAIFFSNLESHQIKVKKEPYIRFCLTLDPKQFDRAISDNALLSLFKCRPADFRHTVDMSDCREEALTLLVSLENEAAAPDPYAKESVILLLKRFLILALRRSPDFSGKEKQPMEDLLASIRLDLDEHFTEDVKIEELCRKYFVNHFYLTHCFKNYTGYSPKKYLTLLRLHYAVSLFSFF